MKEKNITISDIAKLCNVSKQTVSRVINNTGSVKESTKNKILNIIKEYDYKPNLYARNLAGTRKTKNILISVKSNLGHSASIWLNVLINKIISNNKYKNTSIIIEQYYDTKDFEKSLLNTTNSFVDGVIIFYEEKNDTRLKILKKQNIPYIIYGKSYNKDDICVGINNETSIILATEYLFSKNLKNIVFVSALPSPINKEREIAIKKAYKSNNISLNKLNIVKNIKNSQEVYNLTKNLYELRKMPDAIFVSGDEKAVGALKALYDLNLKVPEDISVMGFDNIPISNLLAPSLSTVNFDYDEISKIILEKILNMIDGKEENSLFLDGELVIRESTK